MGFRNDIRALVHDLRAIPGRDFEIRPYAVAVETRAWSGAELGQGIETVTTTPIVESASQPPRVRWLTDEEIAVGGFAEGAVEVGPITPDFPGGGTSIDTLRPNPATNVEVAYVLTGPLHPTGGRYRLRNVRTDRTFGYTVTLEKAADAA